MLELVHNIMRGRCRGLLLFIATKASSDQQTNAMRELSLPLRCKQDIGPSGTLRSYRRFGRTYRAHLQGASKSIAALPLNTGLTGRPETSVSTNLRCVASQKSEDLKHNAIYVVFSYFIGGGFDLRTITCQFYLLRV